MLYENKMISESIFSWQQYSDSILFVRREIISLNKNKMTHQINWIASKSVQKKKQQLNILFAFCLFRLLKIIDFLS